MLIRFFSLIIMCLLLCSNAFAEVEIKRVAVLEFRGVAIEEAMLLKLSDQARAAAVDTLGKEEYLIMTRENMLQVLDDMGKDASCIDGACEVEIGRNIGADLIITGDILKIDASYVLTLKLYETKTGGLLKLTEVEEEGLLPLKNETYTQSVLLLEGGLDLGEAPKEKKGRSAKKKKEKKEKDKNAVKTRNQKLTRGFLIAASSFYVLAGGSQIAYFTSDTLGDARSAYEVNHRMHSAATLLAITSGVFYLRGRQQNKKAAEDEES